MRWIDARTEDPFSALADRRVVLEAEVASVVAETIEDVRRRGDEALVDHAKRFDAPGLRSLMVEEWEFEAAETKLAETERDAILLSIHRVMRFHEAQLYYLTETMERVESGESRFEGLPQTAYRWAEETDHGGEIGQKLVPIRHAGIYVPGGQATYPSSVIMNVCPANVAMAREVTVTTPARKDGSLSPAVLFAARHTHVNRIARVGGAAAIAALALGTESIPRADVVAGPGNRFVNEAKRQLWGSVGLDGFAGPSEVCVLADEHTNARFAAADLITQVEHASDNVAFLVCTSEEKAREILAEVEAQTASAARSETIRGALEHSMVIVCADLEQAIDVVNAIAPEHLSLSVEVPDLVVDRIENAGCILLGEWTPESAGDFAAGPSHTLPTSGAARFGSPVNVMTFMKFQSVVRFAKADLEELVPTIEAFGTMEGFPAHGYGATIRGE